MRITLRQGQPYTITAKQGEKMDDIQFLMDKVEVLTKQLLQTVELAEMATKSRMLIYDQLEVLKDRVERLEIENINLRHKFETRSR